MKLEYLAHNKQTIPTIAQWYYEQWGDLDKEFTLYNFTEKLFEYLNTDKIPLMIVAIEDREVIGVAQLKYREMEIYPEKEHWLGGVYVSQLHRGKNIAEKIIQKIISDAEKFKVHTLYLQTFNLTGGLYRRLGWQPIEKALNHGKNVLIMEKKIIKHN